MADKVIKKYWGIELWGEGNRQPLRACDELVLPLVVVIVMCTQTVLPSRGCHECNSPSFWIKTRRTELTELTYWLRHRRLGINVNVQNSILILSYLPMVSHTVTRDVTAMTSWCHTQVSDSILINKSRKCFWKMFLCCMASCISSL